MEWILFGVYILIGSIIAIIAVAVEDSNCVDESVGVCLLCVIAWPLMCIVFVVLGFCFIIQSIGESLGDWVRRR